MPNPIPRIGRALLASAVALAFLGCSQQGGTTVLEPPSTPVDAKERAKLNPKLKEDLDTVGVKGARKKSR